MVKGDVINGTGAAAAVLNYQPAAGVEVVITTADTNEKVLFYDGTNSAPVLAAGTTPIKIFLNNTLYLRLDAGAAATYRAFSGVQVK